mgnify:CR=1 FL=1
MALKLYPIGIQTFERICGEKLLYIDKTEYRVGKDACKSAMPRLMTANGAFAHKKRGICES